MGEFTLTDNVCDGNTRLNPGVFLCLAQLRGSLAPLFPNLRRLRIVNAYYTLDYLRLFLSPSLETLEIVSVGEACRTNLLSFFSAAVVEVPNLGTLILGPGRLSRDIVNTCLGFHHLKHLELVNAVSEADYQLLKDIGRLKDLEAFVVNAQDVGYAPSRTILEADDAERARVIAKREHYCQQIEEKRECRKRFVEEVQERRRKAMVPRMKGECWMCGIRCKEGNTQCSSCTLKIVEQEKYMRELEEEDERKRKEVKWKEAKRKWKEEESKQRVGQWKGEEEQRGYQKVQEKWRIFKEAEEEMRCEEGVTKYGKPRAEEGLHWSRPESIYQESAHLEEERVEGVVEMRRNAMDEFLPPVERKDTTDGLGVTSFPEADDGSGTQAPIDPQNELLPPMFPKLLKMTVCGSAEMIQDVVELVTSESIVLLCLDMIPMRSPLLPLSTATLPSRRFVDTVDTALHRWAGTIAHVTLSSLPNMPSKLPDEIIEALVRLPQLEHLELNGWAITFNIADYFCCLADAKTMKLKTLHLPNDSNAISIPLSRLRIIAEACPNLRSLRCRFDDLLNIPSYSGPAHIPFLHLLETLTAGDTQPLLGSGAGLKVARYVDNLFPKIKAIKPLEGIAQNANQWRYIDMLVKFRQDARRQTLIKR